MRLANYTVKLEVPEGVPEDMLDQLCQILDVVDLRQLLENAAAAAVRLHSVLSCYVNVLAEE